MASFLLVDEKANSQEEEDEDEDEEAQGHGGAGGLCGEESQEGAYTLSEMRRSNLIWISSDVVEGELQTPD